MSTHYRCNNCRKLWRETELKEIQDYFERVEAGGEVPAGECPDCGALAYLEAVREPQALPVDGRYSSEFLQLGIQTNPGNVFQDLHWKACAWAPKKAKSYNILAFWHTDYDGHIVQLPTGYATFRVQYYAAAKAGVYPLVNKDYISPWYHGGPSRDDVIAERRGVGEVEQPQP